MQIANPDNQQTIITPLSKMSNKENDRKRKRLSIEDKVKIIEKLNRGADHKSIMQEYGIAKSTVADIQKSGDKIMSFANSSDSTFSFTKRKSMKKSTYEDVDKALLQWFNQERAIGRYISGPMLAKQAKFFYKAFGLEGDFNASSGWLTRFKSRYGIRIHVTASDTTNVDGTIEEFKNQLLEFMEREDISLEQIYSADEMSLFWKCLPSRTLASENEESESNMTVNKERVTILCCSNAAASHRLKLTVVGKPKCIRTSKGTICAPENLPVHYFSQPSAWMNTSLFSRWFHEIFEPQVRSRLRSYGLTEKAVLLIDNAPSHPDENHLRSEDGQIYVKFLPSSVSSLIPAVDKEVLGTLRKRYRASLMEKYYAEGLNLNSFWIKHALLEAVHDLSDAWSNISPACLTKTWTNFGVVVPLITDEKPEIPDEVIVESVAHLAQSLMGGENVDQINVKEWFDCDVQEPSFEYLKEDDIVMLISNGAGEKSRENNVPKNVEPVEEESQNGEVPTENEGERTEVSHEAALKCVSKLLEYLESQSDSLLSDHMTLRKLKTTISSRIKKKS